ncbi:hypothetical protein EVAR_56141_1 [Eumeta japonica]|uniref:Uncharacterized protein n=1 Tax=Eumeta variegata TaxID=151549 RepID=A0A4C1Y6C3_EUMVA|nr:hypothetical protein EVAR_56141_1 [Eumeta japonica]
MERGARPSYEDGAGWRQILSILEESDSDYEDSTSKNEDDNHISIRSQESDTDQDASDNNSDNEPNS